MYSSTSGFGNNDGMSDESSVVYASVLQYSVLLKVSFRSFLTPSERPRLQVHVG
jgi:hypothetical protein